MPRTRIIPSLLLKNGGLVKSIRFKDHRYVGDPINAVKIFNEKEVDEIVLLDISATLEKRCPNFGFIKEIASEAFMPLAYGGGITTLDEIKILISQGVEKVVLNTTAFKNPKLIQEAVKYVGSQSIVISMDVKRNFWGHYKVYIENGRTNTPLDPVVYSKKLEDLGVGEILLTSMDRDGTFAGYDLNLIKLVSSSVSIPVISCGGAGTIEDFTKAKDAGASAVCAGSMFVFQRPHRAVLISYPTQNQMKEKGLI
jgi:imidazole glycerol-phosphate synthase subunit HisF